MSLVNFPALLEPARGALMQNACETTIRVPYAEPDQMGVMYYANPFVWFEVGKAEFLRSLGFNYREMDREEGCFIVVMDARCRFRAPAHYDDQIVIRTRLKAMRGSMVRFAHEAVGESRRQAGRRGRGDAHGR